MIIMPPYPAEVIRIGTDTSARPIYASRYMADWWAGVCRRLDFTPVIVQGAWMSKVAGGGASASAGYHDRGGSFDVRTWSLSSDQQAKLIRVLREGGAGAWVRNSQHGGMDEHCHFVLGSDPSGLASGAATQWGQYIAGRDGLASNGPDYHPRPSPLVLVPPAAYMEEPDPMAEYAAQLADIKSGLAALSKLGQLDQIQRDLAKVLTKLDNSADRERKSNELLRRLRNQVDTHSQAEIDAVLAEG